MTDDDRHEVFGGLDPPEYEAEAEARWGDTGAYRESARRARGYSKDDWARFTAESDAVNDAVATLLDDRRPRPTTRARWTPRSATVCSSTAGSTRARTRCTRSSGGCT